MTQIAKAIHPGNDAHRKKLGLTRNKIDSKSPIEVDGPIKAGADKK